jgi:hypothetical protein
MIELDNVLSEIPKYLFYFTSEKSTEDSKLFTTLNHI